jgi:hypothetical protein
LWVEWSIRLLTVLALVAIVVGLVVLALPEPMEGKEMIRLDAAHGLRVADLIGAGLVGAGALLTWVSALAWQRQYIEQ